MSNKRVRLYLQDIEESINKIQSFIEGMGYDDFYYDEKTKAAVIRMLEIIGEAVKNIPNEIRIKYDNVPWKPIARMRDKLIHAYFGVSYKIVWETIQNDLPRLSQTIKAILEDGV